MVKLSIVIPAYNEEKRIASTLDEYLKFFNEDTEIIVVLNGCKDKTAEVVAPFQQKYPDILQVINIKEAIGKGGAVQVGFQQSQGEIIGFVDADGSTSPQEYQKLANNFSGNDAVIASRWLKGAVIKNRTLLRKASSKIFVWAVKLFFRMPFSDTQCGAKIFKRKAILPLLSQLKEKGMVFDVELLYAAYKKGLRIKEMPTVWIDKPGSEILGSPWRVITKGLIMFKALFKIKNRIYGQKGNFQ
jgi:glycosyltransferase involved in cell wall biosynthesis